jgi:hypothetical protein
MKGQNIAEKEKSSTLNAKGMCTGCKYSFCREYNTEITRSTHYYLGVKGVKKSNGW